MRPQTALLIVVRVGEEASDRRARLIGSANTSEELPFRIMTGAVVLPAIASVLGWAWCFLEEATLATRQIALAGSPESGLMGTRSAQLSLDDVVSWGGVGGSKTAWAGTELAASTPNFSWAQRIPTFNTTTLQSSAESRSSKQHHGTC